MIKIRTKTEIGYDPVNPLNTAKIAVEMIDWNERQGIYQCNVNYIAEFAIGTTMMLKNKIIGISQDKFNELHMAVDSQIPELMTPYEKRELRKKLALLIYVQNDFIDVGATKLIYGTIPNDWEMINE